MLEKNAFNTKHYGFTIPKGNLLITLICLINRDKDENLILILLCKENLENKEISASYWLKPHKFMFYIPDLALRYKKPIYSSSVDNLEEH